MTYECLVAGLEDISLVQKPKLSETELLELLYDNLSDSDIKLLELLRMKITDANIQDIFLSDATQDRFHESKLSEDDFCVQIMYEEGAKCKNKFIRKWFEFNLNLNNVLAAAICIKHGYNADEVIVGNNEVAQLLRRGNLKNANLAAILPELREIVSLTEISNLLDREKHIDALRWQWLENQTLFDYFDIEVVLAYYLKSCILHRWDELTKEQGEQVFRQMLSDMKRDVKF